MWRVCVYQIPGQFGCSKSQETGSSPSSVLIHVTLGSHSVFSSVKWVHAKIISKFPSVLTFDDALIARSLNLKEVP